MLLLQTQLSGQLDTVALGTWAIGSLLTLIAVLIAFIWQDSKAQAETRHRDIIALIDRIMARTEKLEEEQQNQKLQIVKLESKINTRNSVSV